MSDYRDQRVTRACRGVSTRQRRGTLQHPLLVSRIVIYDLLEYFEFGPSCFEMSALILFSVSLFLNESKEQEIEDAILIKDATFIKNGLVAPTQEAESNTL